jgi:mono/diheme cytochrome c family protein
MRTSAIVMEPAAFEAGARAEECGRRAARAGGPGGLHEQRCGSCHAGGGNDGDGRADLDKPPAYAEQAGKPLEDFIVVDRRSNAYVQPGFPKGLMPPFSTLPQDQLDSLVTYLVESSKGGGK